MHFLYASCGDYDEGKSPEHAVDNEQRWDAILFSFSEAINLTQIGLSWYANDADISVLHTTGNDWRYGRG